MLMPWLHYATWTASSLIYYQVSPVRRASPKSLISVRPGPTTAPHTPQMTTPGAPTSHADDIAHCALAFPASADANQPVDHCFVMGKSGKMLIVIEEEKPDAHIFVID